MNNIILPAIITNSLLIRLGYIFPTLQYPILGVIAIELAILILTSFQHQHFNPQGQILFGLGILAFFFAVLFGV